MTRPLYAFIGLAVALSLGHHVDHVLRGATGWPLADTANPFTYSLLVYPAILAGLALSRRGRAGPRFWLLLSSAGAVFVLAVHLGPTADDSLAGIAAGFGSPVAAAAALAWLGLFIAALLGLSLYEASLWRGRNRRPIAE